MSTLGEVLKRTTRSERSQTIAWLLDIMDVHLRCTHDTEARYAYVGQSSLTAGGYILGFGTASV